MYVCVCNAMREREVERVVREGASTVSEVYRRLERKAQCGKCVPDILAIQRSLHATRRHEASQ